MKTLIPMFALLSTLMACSTRKDGSETARPKAEPELVPEIPGLDDSKNSRREKELEPETPPEQNTSNERKSHVEPAKAEPEKKQEHVTPIPTEENRPNCELKMNENHIPHELVFIGDTEKIFAKLIPQHGTQEESILIENLTDSHDKPIATHLSKWEIDQLLNTKFFNCVKKLFQHTEHLANANFSNLEKFPAKSRMMIRSIPAQYQGFYAKIAHPEKANYFVPNGETFPLNCSKLYDEDFDRYTPQVSHAQRDHLRKQCASQKLYCKDLKFEPIMHKHTLSLDRPLHSMDDWIQYREFDPYQLFINTEWFYVVDFGPHDTPCTAIFGYEISNGKILGTPLTNTQEKLDLFAVNKNHTVEFIDRHDVETHIANVEWGFSGSLVVKEGIFQDMQLISWPKEVAARAAIGMDRDHNLIVFASAGGFDVDKLRRFMTQNLDASYVMILDGGGSTHLHYRNGSIMHHLKRKDKQGFRPLPALLSIGTQEHSFEIPKN